MWFMKKNWSIGTAGKSQSLRWNGWALIKTEGGNNTTHTGMALSTHICDAAAIVELRKELKVIFCQQRGH